MSQAPFVSTDASLHPWRPSGADWPALAAGDVHLWRIDLDPETAALASLERMLSGDEHERAAGFGRPDLRRRYVVGRGALRQILGGYLGLAPAELRFAYGEQGKPRLVEPTADLAILSEFSPPSPRAPRAPRAPKLRFNLAHCGDLGLLAVTLGLEVGVDLERLRPIRKARALAARYFTPEEQVGLDAGAREASASGGALSQQFHSNSGVDSFSGLEAEKVAPPVSSYEAAFLQLWCCKEAYLKATGEALSRPLGSFGVDIGFGETRFEDQRDDDPGSGGRAFDGPGVRPRVLQVDGDVSMAERWSLARIDGLEGHVAAMVTRGRPAAQLRWRFEPPCLTGRHPNPESST